MTVDASTSLRPRRYRLYGTRLSEGATELYPIEESPDEQQQTGLSPRTKKWGLMTLVAASMAAAAVLGLSMNPRYSDDTSRAEHSRFSSLRNRFVMSSGNHHKHKAEKPPKCTDGGYSKRTLKRAYELPFPALFPDSRGQTKYEASSVIVVGSDAYAVCDSSWSISKFHRNLVPFSSSNLQIGDPHREPEDSGYEALFHDDGTFYVVRESVNLFDDSSQEEESSSQNYHAIIEELDLSERDYQVKQACPSEFEFEGDSKGFEGAVAIRDLNNELVVLGLCEGNYCSEKYKSDRGNGRLVAMRKVEHDDGTCEWSTIRQINIPSSAHFMDYSAISLSGQKVAISSQEESQLWVGRLEGQVDSGLWNVDKIEFSKEEEAKVYDFPKNDKCQTVYCNIEGIHWIDENMLLAVSDKMKSKGKQDFRCFDKDQSVHAFVLP